MTGLTYIKAQPVSIKGHSCLSEAWVRDRIVEDPTILGLGDVEVKDVERILPKAGRLDLLLADPETEKRYEVELMLGATDESHIIRCLEYWDIERKRYPQYDHTAVIVAEEITSRFLNVIGLFNGTIPLMAIQMNAVQVGEVVSLLFTTVLDEVRLGRNDEDEEALETTDRAFWETRATKAMVGVVDEILEIIHEFAPGLELKYNKFYIGLAFQGMPNNFAIFVPRRNIVRLEVRLAKDDEVEQKLEASGVNVMEFDKRSGRYRIRLEKGDLKKHREMLRELCERAYFESGKSVQ